MNTGFSRKVVFMGARLRGRRAHIPWTAHFSGQPQRGAQLLQMFEGKLRARLPSPGLKLPAPALSYVAHRLRGSPHDGVVRRSTDGSTTLPVLLQQFFERSLLALLRRRGEKRASGARIDDGTFVSVR